jgi:hypothetical protein
VALRNTATSVRKNNVVEQDLSGDVRTRLEKPSSGSGQLLRWGSQRLRTQLKGASSVGGQLLQCGLLPAERPRDTSFKIALMFEPWNIRQQIAHFRRQIWEDNAQTEHNVDTNAQSNAAAPTGRRNHRERIGTCTRGKFRLGDEQFQHFGILRLFPTKPWTLMAGTIRQ